MKVYFVRHGESELTEKVHQFPESPLSNLGLQQATSLAKRFIPIPIDLILTSTYKRAVQTALEIEKLKQVPVVQSNLLVERRMPSSFLGKSVDDPLIVSLHKTIREHFYEEKWHLMDEENFADLLARAKEGINFIISQKKEHIVAVTHGYFLTVIIFYILFGEQIEPKSFQFFRKHISNSNTGITMCEHVKGVWKLVTWNDIAHL